jgi:glycosyltransferase involved in cell wall biosynthesis
VEIGDDGARRPARPVKLSVLVPVFNEAASVERLVRRLAAVDLDLEIIVVDDASTDDSRARLAAMDDVPDLRVLHHAANRGKGAAVRTALAAATGEAVVIQDADLEYSPEDFPALLAPIERGEAAVVYGVRDLSSQPWSRRLGNRVLTWATNLLFGARLHDMETCYKMMRTEAARALDLRASRFDIEPEITAKLLARDYRIHEVPIRYTPRQDRKLSPWRDGPHALWTLLMLRFRT